MFTDKNLVVTRLFLDDKKTRTQVEDFCASNGLKMEEADYYCGVFDGDKMLAGGGFSENVIKYVAVDKSARSLNLTNVIVSHLREELISRGETNIFVYTKIDNTEICSKHLVPFINKYLHIEEYLKSEIFELF